VHFTRWYSVTGWFSIIISTQHVLMWTKLHYFARVFNPTKNLFVETIGIVIDDMKWFLAFLGLTMLGFGFAFFSLYRQDRERFVVSSLDGTRVPCEHACTPHDWRACVRACLYQCQQEHALLILHHHVWH
jgi:hypothetical protein